MKKTKTEFQKLRSMHAKLNSKNSPTMKGAKSAKKETVVKTAAKKITGSKTSGA